MALVTSPKRAHFEAQPQPHMPIVHICAIKNKYHRPLWERQLSMERGAWFHQLRRQSHSGNPSNIAILHHLKVAKRLEKNLKTQFSCSFGKCFWIATKALPQIEVNLES
jgi:hypothetical protein